MAYGIWGGVAFVAALLAIIGSLLVWAFGTTTALSIGFVVICILMMLIILAQKPKGGGLSGAFGGAGGASTQTAFGAKTGDVMTWATIVLFVLFIFTAMGLTWITKPKAAVEVDPTIIQQINEEAAAGGAASGTQTVDPQIPGEPSVTGTRNVSLPDPAEAPALEAAPDATPATETAPAPASTEPQP